MSDLHNPASRLETGIGLLLLDFLATLFHARDVLSLFDNLSCWLAEIPLVGTQVLLALGTLDDDLIQHHLQLTYVLSMSSGHDDRQRDSTTVHQQVTLASIFFPDPSGWDRRFLGQEAP